MTALSTEPRLSEIAWQGFVQLGWPAVGLFAAQAGGFLALLVVSNALGKADYGRFGLALTAGVCAGLLVQWGIDPLVTRMLAQPERLPPQRLLAVLFRQKQLAAGAALAGGGILIWLWGYNDSVLLYAGICDGVILAFTAAPAFDVKRRMAAYFFFLALRQAMYVCAALILARQFAAHATVFNFVLLHAMLNAVQVGLEWFWIRRNYGRLDWTNATLEARRLWFESTPMAAASGAAQLVAVCGPPALEFSGRGGELGSLYLSNQLATVTSSFLAIPARALHVFLSTLRGDSAAFRPTVFKLALSVTIAGAAVAIVAGLVAQPVVGWLFRPELHGAADLYAIDVWRVVGMLASAVFGSALICRQRTRAYAYCHGAALLLTLGLLAAFVPSYGALAAAGAVVAGRVAFALLAAVVFVGGATEQSA